MKFNITEFPNRTIDKNINQIKSLANLKQGWDFGEGLPFDSKIINNAIVAYNKLSVFFNVSIHPTTNGGITLSSSIGDNFYDITLLPQSDYVEYTHEKGIGSTFETIETVCNLMLNEAIEKTFRSKNLISAQCFTSEPLILENTTQQKNASKVTSSNPMAMPFQYFAIPVQSQKVKRYANTLISTTNPQLQTQ